MLKQLQKYHKRIIFVRHGESVGNARGLDDNSLADTPNHRFPLTQVGYQQACLCGRILRSKGIIWDRAFISSYTRTEQTHDGINVGLIVCKPIMDPRLDEWWRGIWHTMTKADIARLYPLEAQIQKREGWYHYRAPGGQSGPDVELQIRSFLSDFLFGCYSSWGDILLVGHGKWAILFWRIMTGSTVEQAAQRLKDKPFGNCSITIFGSKVTEITD